MSFIHRVHHSPSTSGSTPSLSKSKSMECARQRSLLSDASHVNDINGSGNLCSSMNHCISQGIAEELILPDPGAVTNIAGLLASIPGIQNSDLFQETRITLPEQNKEDMNAFPLATSHINQIPEDDTKLNNNSNVSTSSNVNKRLTLPTVSKRGSSFALPFAPPPTTEAIDNAMLLLDSDGIPTIPESFQNVFPQNIPLSYSTLEDWTFIVNQPESLDERSQTQQRVLMELLETELNYINQLSAIIKVHVATLLHLKSLSSGLLNEIDVTQVFGNLGEVFRANCSFFNECLLQPYARSRLYGMPLNASLLKCGFLKIEQYMAPYEIYCQTLADSVDYVREMEKKNGNFARYLSWCDKQSSEFREGLRSLLARPYQRLTKYALLIERIKKYTDDPVQLSDLTEMHQSVVACVSRINVDKQKQVALQGLSKFHQNLEPYQPYSFPKGEGYESIVAKWTSQDWILQVPCLGFKVREIIKSGKVKFREGASKWCEATCYLFTDFLLLCKSSKKQSDRQRIYHPPIRLDKLAAYKLNDGILVLLQFCDFFIPSALYSLSTDSKNIQEWLDKLLDTKAQFLKSSGLVDIAGDSAVLPSVSSAPSLSTMDATLLNNNSRESVNNFMSTMSLVEKLAEEQVMASSDSWPSAVECKIRPPQISVQMRNAVNIPPNGCSFSSAESSTAPANQQLTINRRTEGRSASVQPLYSTEPTNNHSKENTAHLPMSWRGTLHLQTNTLPVNGNSPSSPSHKKLSSPTPFTL